MAETDYGVVQRDGVWVIIGAGLRYGAYPTRRAAERAARALAETGPVGVRLHVQDDETGELKPPVRLG